jgi:hypothetical protein
MARTKFLYPQVPVKRPELFGITRFWLPLLWVLLAFVLVTQSVRAHGGFGLYQIRGAPAGPYALHVWTSPGLLRTGEVHVDTAIFDAAGQPALQPWVHVGFTPLEGDAPPLFAMAGPPADEFPYVRGASLRIESPGAYRLAVTVHDGAGIAGSVATDLRVQAVGWSAKLAILLLGVASAGFGFWLLLHSRAFWGIKRIPFDTARRARVRQTERESIFRGGSVSMGIGPLPAAQPAPSTWLAQLNGPLHARALWIFMLVVVAHWMEHVLQVYQIYALSWSPDDAGGLLGVIYPQLIESELLHFVYDFIQWAGILLLWPGFRGRAATLWTVAVVAQTWHFCEHVLLMGQYLSGYYMFGAPHQISLLQLWVPRAELHFIYNLIVFIPMVIAVHAYLQPKPRLSNAATYTVRPSGQ